jgi:hypothetical protein
MSRIREHCLSALLMLTAVQAAWGQGIRRPPRKPPEFPKFNLSGTLDRIEGGRVVLTTEKGFTWILQPKPNVQVELTGKAVPAFLAPGHFIALMAKLDMKHGTTVEKVARLTVFMPDKKRQPGIQPDLGFGDLEKATRKKREGTASEQSSEEERAAAKRGAISASGTAAGDKAKRDAAAKAAKSNVDSFVIHGRITAIEKGKFVVLVPNNPYVKPNLRIEVAEDAEIDVELTGLPALAAVQPGDHIQARGDQVGEGLGFAHILTFRPAQPLGTPQARKKLPPRSEPSAKKNPPPSSKK